MLLEKLNANALMGELLHETSQIIEVACQPIHAGHHNGVPVADERQHGFELGSLHTFARGLLHKYSIYVRLV
jgi:hypothetical protein